MKHMNILEIEKLAYHKMKDRKTKGRENGFIFYHGRRVGKLAINIYKQVSGEIKQQEMDMIYCASLYHDIGKGIEPHNETGAEITKFYLRDLCTPHEVNTVSRIVFEHNRRGSDYNDNSFLGRIVQDADILDHMGTMDIWIAFQWHAEFNETVDVSLEFFSSGKWAEITDTLRSLLNFECSIDAFDKRRAFTQEFINRFEREAQGQLF